LVERVRGKADEQRAREATRRGETDQRDPDELQHAGRSPCAKVRAEAALAPAPEVVCETDRGNRRDGGPSRQRRRPADERQAPAAIVDGERPGGEQRVDELAPPVQEPAQVATGRPVAERQRHLADAEAGASRVDRHPDLAAEARRERERGPPGAA
jgi:hypothetical protein